MNSKRRMASNEEKTKAKTENQKKVFDFFIEHFKSQKPFTKKEVEGVTTWQRKSFPTYWSKQLKQFVVPAGGESVPCKRSLQAICAVGGIPATRHAGSSGLIGLHAPGAR